MQGEQLKDSGSCLYKWTLRTDLCKKEVLVLLIKALYVLIQHIHICFICFEIVAQEEWRSSHTIEINMNQTLKIPCFQNISAEISELTVAWSVVSAAPFSPLPTDP